MLNFISKYTPFRLFHIFCESTSSAKVYQPFPFFIFQRAQQVITFRTELQSWSIIRFFLLLLLAHRDTASRGPASSFSPARLYVFFFFFFPNNVLSFFLSFFVYTNTAVRILSISITYARLYYSVPQHVGAQC